MKTLTRFYIDLEPIYFRNGKKILCCKHCFGLMTVMLRTVWDVKLMLFGVIALLMMNCFLILICLASRVSLIDSGMSHTIQSASKLSMSKAFEKGKTEMGISVEKEQGKRNSIDLWKKNGFFSSQVCDLSLEKANLPENTIFYINQGYLSYKYNKKDNEVKLLRPRYHTTTGNFLGLENCLAYLTVRGDYHEQFSDYAYSKENSKVLYSTLKLKIPNNFTSTISNRQRI